MSVCVCEGHLVASQLERSDNGKTVTRDLPKWSALFSVHFPSVSLEKMRGDGRERNNIRRRSNTEGWRGRSERDCDLVSDDSN